MRTQITKVANKLQTAITNANQFLVKNLREDLSNTHKRLEEKDEAVWALLSDDTVAADQAIGEEWSDTAMNAISQADQFLAGTNPSTTPSSPSSSSSQNTSTKARLPKTDLPKFSGKSASEYQGWWNAFESLIDGRTDLSKVDKLTYLKNC